MVITESSVRAALASVMDPEIPAISIVDLGIVERVAIAGESVEIDLLPTFSGCPALDAIKDDVERAARAAAPGTKVVVRFVLSPAWTTDRMTDQGRAALGSFGIAPPLLRVGRKPACPYCGSTRTHEESAFGPTLCRTIRYCDECKNPFEGFKTKA
ncbi:MAG TPA: 1,2-phenylacetyl-CoA epoxidase subunit PaaD [Actinomycetota bacterium]